MARDPEADEMLSMVIEPTKLSRGRGIPVVATARAQGGGVTLFSCPPPPHTPATSTEDPQLTATKVSHHQGQGQAVTPGLRAPDPVPTAKLAEWPTTCTTTGTATHKLGCSHVLRASVRQEVAGPRTLNS